MDNDIHLSVAADDVETFSRLLAQRPEMAHCVDKDGNNILHIAVSYDSQRVLQRFMSMFSPTEAVPAQWDKADLKELLRWPNHEGYTPFHCALAKGSLHQCIEFLEHGAELFLPSKIRRAYTRHECDVSAVTDMLTSSMYILHRS